MAARCHRRQYCTTQRLWRCYRSTAPTARQLYQCRGPGFNFQRRELRGDPWYSSLGIDQGSPSRILTLLPYISCKNQGQEQSINGTAPPAPCRRVTPTVPCYLLPSHYPALVLMRHLIGVPASEGWKLPPLRLSSSSRLHSLRQRGGRGQDRTSVAADSARATHAKLTHQGTYTWCTYSSAYWVRRAWRAFVYWRVSFSSHLQQPAGGWR